MTRWMAGLCSVLVLITLAAQVLAADVPVAVSPGDASKVAVVESRCPTFSWGEVEGVKGYELLVYRLGEDGEEAREVLRQVFAGSVDGWTPALESCLERGGRYAWSVRAVGSDEKSEWSAPNLFEVQARPSGAEFEAALEVVRRYLGEARTGNLGVPAGIEESSGAASAPPVAGSPEGTSAGPAPLSVAMGDSALQVNGAAVVTTATLARGVGAQLCLAVDYRYVDLGDGTVQDCNTGKMWLKNASCLGQGTWNESGTSVFELVADLNDTGVGSDFGCTDYTEGTYTDWEVPAMTDLCGLWDGSCTGPSCCTASEGIVDTSVGTSPTVANAAGDGKWAEEDAFVAVQSSVYWSATQVIVGLPAAVSLDTGDVGQVGESSSLYVWPVRGGQ